MGDWFELGFLSIERIFIFIFISNKETYLTFRDCLALPVFVLVK
jgi:hypothetical protein